MIRSVFKTYHPQGFYNLIGLEECILIKKGGGHMEIAYSTVSKVWSSKRGID